MVLLLIMSLVFSYLSKVLSSGFLQFQGNCVDGQNNSKYRDVAPLKCNVLHSYNIVTLWSLRECAMQWFALYHQTSFVADVYQCSGMIHHSVCSLSFYTHIINFLTSCVSWHALHFLLSPAIALRTPAAAASVAALCTCGFDATPLANSPCAFWKLAPAKRYILCTLRHCQKYR